jgi:hypothetical protein
MAAEANIEAVKQAYAAFTAGDAAAAMANVAMTSNGSSAATAR